MLFGLFNGMKSSQEESAGLPTVTVRGFLNFKTTVDGTVIVFTPVPEIRPPLPIKTTSMDNGELGKDLSFASLPRNSIRPLQTHIANMLENKIEESFLPHISDNAVLPHTHSDKTKSNQFPTGLVTVLGGTSVDGSSTTVHETKVIGTYMDGKYAQILQSTSRVLPHITSYSAIDQSSKIESSENIVIYSSTKPVSTSFSVKGTPSAEESSPFVLMTASLESSTPLATSVESSMTSIPTSVESSMTSITSSVESLTTSITSSVESLTTSITPSVESLTSVEPLTASVTTSFEPLTTSVAMADSTVVSISKTVDNPLSSTPVLIVPQQKSRSNIASFETMTSEVENTPELESSVLLRSSFDTPPPFSATTTGILEVIPSLRPVISTTFSEEDNMVPTKNHRNSTSRTRFFSPRRPSQTVKLNRFKVKLTLRQDSHDDESFSTDDEDLDEDEMESETTTIDPAKVVFQETTITSQVTLHVGRRKSIRILTITTSVPLTVHPTDMPSSLKEEESDPYHHVETRTFTSTERALKTSIVPVFDGKTTSYHKVTESFFIMKYITAYRTFPIGEDEQQDAITLDAAANIQSSVTQSAPPPEQLSTLPPFLGLSNNPLAAVYLGLQQLNAQMTLYSSITHTSTYVTTETFYNTKTVRFYDGRANKFRTVSEPTSTARVTLTTTLTSLLPYLNTQALQQQFIAPPTARQEPHFNTITYTTVSTATSLSTRIYTLIYNGFSTKFRTVTSTSTYPTTVIVTSSTKVPFVYPYSS